MRIRGWFRNVIQGFTKATELKNVGTVRLSQEFHTQTKSADIAEKSSLASAN